MDWWKFIERMAMLGVIVLLLAIIGVKFWPKVEQERSYRARVERLEAENRVLEERIAELKRNQEELETDPRFLERVAREELGYVREGETVFRFISEEVE